LQLRTAHQLSIVLKQKVGDVGVAVLAGVRQGGVVGTRLSVHQRTVLQKVFDKIQVTLLEWIS
jgi:hypothetical protein